MPLFEEGWQLNSTDSIMCVVLLKETVGYQTHRTQKQNNNNGAVGEIVRPGREFGKSGVIVVCVVSV